MSDDAQRAALEALRDDHAFLMAIVSGLFGDALNTIELQQQRIAELEAQCDQSYRQGWAAGANMGRPTV